jgi:hypothetical protein
MANRRTKALRRINLYRQSPDAAPEPGSVRMRVLRRDKGICRYCQEPGDTVDHVTPLPMQQPEGRSQRGRVPAGARVGAEEELGAAQHGRAITSCTGVSRTSSQP